MSLYLSIEPQTGHFAFCLVTNGLSFEKAGKVTGRKHLRWLLQIGQYLWLPLNLRSRASFRTVMRYLRGIIAINLFRLVFMICILQVFPGHCRSFCKFPTHSWQQHPFFYKNLWKAYSNAEPSTPVCHIFYQQPVLQ